MKLTVYQRSKKENVNKLRYSGEIPGVIYGPRRKSEPVFVKEADFQAFQRSIPSKQLSTTLFTIEIGKETHKALVKGIQRHKTTYAIEHLDFIIVAEDLPVTVAVPINCHGIADCAGIKLGGMLRQSIRTLKVQCLPNAIPSEFVTNVKDMGISDSKRLSDLKIPTGVRPIAKMDEVFVTVAKR